MDVALKLIWLELKKKNSSIEHLIMTLNDNGVMRKSAIYGCVIQSCGWWDERHLKFWCFVKHQDHTFILENTKKRTKQMVELLNPTALYQNHMLIFNLMPAAHKNTFKWQKKPWWNTFTYLIGLHTARQKEVFAFDHFDCFLTAGYEFSSHERSI